MNKFFVNKNDNIRNVVYDPNQISVRNYYYSSLDERLIHEAINIILDALNFENKNNIHELLFSNVFTKFINNDRCNLGIINQYNACKTEENFRAFKDILKIEDEQEKIISKSELLNTDFSNLARFIQKNYVKISSINPDGTFEKLINVEPEKPDEFVDGPYAYDTVIETACNNVHSDDCNTNY